MAMKASRFSRCARCDELDAALEELVDSQMDTTITKERLMIHVSTILKKQQTFRMRQDGSILHASQ